MNNIVRENDWSLYHEHFSKDFQLAFRCYWFIIRIKATESNGILHLPRRAMCKMLFWHNGNTRTARLSRAKYSQ